MKNLLSLFKPAKAQRLGVRERETNLCLMTPFIITLNNLNCLKYNKSDPNYFSDEWVSKMKADTHENWRLKLLNLKKILQTLTDYYSEVIILFFLPSIL